MQFPAHVSEYNHDSVAFNQQHFEQEALQSVGMHDWGLPIWNRENPFV